MEKLSWYERMSAWSWKDRPIVDYDPKMPKTWRALIGVVGGGYDEAISAGDVNRRRLWYSYEMLTSQQVADRLDVTTQTINRRRRTHRLFGLELEGQPSYHYPAWQFEGNVQSTLPLVLKELAGKRSWDIYLFLLRQEGLLRGKSPLSLLRMGEIDEVIRVVRILLDDDVL
jgi:hypothetical protein